MLQVHILKQHYSGVYTPRSKRVVCFWEGRRNKGINEIFPFSSPWISTGPSVSAFSPSNSDKNRLLFTTVSVWEFLSKYNQWETKVLVEFWCGLFVNSTLPWFILLKLIHVLFWSCAKQRWRVFSFCPKSRTEFQTSIPSNRAQVVRLALRRGNAQIWCPHSSSPEHSLLRFSL